MNLVRSLPDVRKGKGEEEASSETIIVSASFGQVYANTIMTTKINGVVGFGRLRLASAVEKADTWSKDSQWTGSGLVTERGMELSNQLLKRGFNCVDERLVLQGQVGVYLSDIKASSFYCPSLQGSGKRPQHETQTGAVEHVPPVG